MNARSQTAAACCAALLAVGLTGCGTTAPQALRVHVDKAPNGVLALMGNTTSKKPTIASVDTSGLTFTITPSSGPAGTPVKISVTGCGDPSGTQHAVSYNDGNVGGQFADLSKVHSINMDVKGSDLNGQFNIPQHPSGDGVFYVQCGNAVLTTTFTVTP